MKKEQIVKRILPGITAICITVLVVSNCTQSGPCEGSLTLENPIPDTTVAVGDTLFIDLSDPPVFLSTEGEVSYSFSTRSGPFYSGMNFMGSQGTILIIIGENAGETIYELEAASGCLENSQIIIVKITEP